jgi:hypothetical protein
MWEVISSDSIGEEKRMAFQAGGELKGDEDEGSLPQGRANRTVAGC